MKHETPVSVNNESQDAIIFIENILKRHDINIGGENNRGITAFMLLNFKYSYLPLQIPYSPPELCIIIDKPFGALDEIIGI